MTPTSLASQGQRPKNRRPGELESDTRILPWYVVQTKIRQEQLACDNLVQQGFIVYFPKIKQLKRLRGRQAVHLEPMFPRYIFLQPEAASRSISPVRSTLGVTNLVRFGQKPAVMRPEDMLGIREVEFHRNEASEKDISPFKPGGRVRVANGPLVGMEGLISNVSSERVIVLLQLLGQDTRVSISHHELLTAH